MNQYIKDLFVSPPGAEIEIIQNLDLAGDGDLRAGVRNVWGSGVRVGSVAAAVILGGSCLIYWIVSRKQRVSKMVETVGTAFNAGFEVGKRQEREFRGFVEERSATSIV